VPGTKCLNCKEEPQYREKGKVHPYSGITAGALVEPKQSDVGEYPLGVSELMQTMEFIAVRLVSTTPSDAPFMLSFASPLPSALGCCTRRSSLHCECDFNVMIHP
jgi:hypothetical protein